MSNEKEKAKWLKIQENKKKCCANCTQLAKYDSGEFICHFAKSKDDIYGGGVIIHFNDIHRPRKCYDIYNGLNLK